MNEEKFCNIKQNKELNAIAHTLPSKRQAANFYSGQGYITPLGNFGVRIQIGLPDRNVTLGTSSHKLLDVLLNQCAKTGGRKIRFSVHAYKEMMGVSDYYNARKRILQDMDSLFSLDIGIKDENGNFLRLRLMESYGLHNGTVCVELTPGFMELLRGCTVAPLPVGVLKINSHKNPHSYYFGRKLSELIYIQKGNPCKIKIENLIKSSPIMPSEEELKTNGNRNYVQRIMKPFIRDMEAMPDTIQYKYTYNGETISGPKLQNMPYTEFKNVMVEAGFDMG